MLGIGIKAIHMGFKQSFQRKKIGREKGEEIWIGLIRMKNGDSLMSWIVG
ncbi:hypothetical protein JOC48_004038 [Aquibacillus albus]|uniref:Transposase n=1 Tax=Aquibacillus albus TaxID=1168171 RepID=A0ABS2N5P3_9BACI|nr:hypothetical protein [Aquibacillus albus]